MNEPKDIEDLRKFADENDLTLFHISHDKVIGRYTGYIIQYYDPFHDEDEAYYRFGEVYYVNPCGMNITIPGGYHYETKVQAVVGAIQYYNINIFTK